MFISSHLFTTFQCFYLFLILKYVILVNGTRPKYNVCLTYALSLFLIPDILLQVRQKYVYCWQCKTLFMITRIVFHGCIIGCFKPREQLHLRVHSIRKPRGKESRPNIFLRNTMILCTLTWYWRYESVLLWCPWSLWLGLEWNETVPWGNKPATCMYTPSVR